MDLQPEETPEPARPRKRRGGCFRTGCLGCLGVVILAIIIPAMLLLVAFIQGAPERNPTSRNAEHAVPGAAGDLAQVDGEGRLLDASPGSTPPAAPPAARAGRLELDLSTGIFEVEPGPAGQPIRVEAAYDAGAFELVEEYESGTESDGWVYRVRFQSTVGMFRHLLGGGMQLDENRIRIIVPRDVPISLTGSIGTGESNLELGGLWLTELDLSTGIGEHHLRISEPLREPLEAVYLRGSIGEVHAYRLGNASPARLDLGSRIGEMHYDLRGEWSRDSQVTVSCGIGECHVRVPDEKVARVDMASVGLLIGETGTSDLDRRGPSPEGAPTLTLRVRGRIGEITVTD